MFSKLVALAAAAAILAGTTPGQAHAPTIEIAGFQYLWIGEFEGGHTGKLGAPVAGPVDLDVQNEFVGPARTSIDEGIDGIMNLDQVEHTFTECGIDCDTASAGAGDDPAFDITIAPGANEQFVLLPNLDSTPRGLEARTYTFFCKTYPFMRGEIAFSG